MFYFHLKIVNSVFINGVFTCYIFVHVTYKLIGGSFKVPIIITPF